MFDVEWTQKEIEACEAYYRQARVIHDQEDLINWIIGAIEDETGLTEINSFRAKRLLVEWSKSKEVAK